ncbi:MAG: PQQ-like beta-propeller repeat protein [Puniceicoccales bacterium]|nr:PQQ-like beta-propeller repeat protein [Puniceicoccales bacterium]
MAISAVCSAVCASAQESYMRGRRFAATDFTAGKVCIVEADGRVGWSHPAKSSNDLWVLPGGTVLFGNGKGAKEVSFKDGTVRFEHKTRSETFGVQRLDDGGTLVAECSSGKLIEYAPDGKTVRAEVSLLASKITPQRPLPGGHGFMRNARKLKNGNYLCALNGASEVVEFDPSGKRVWSAKVPGQAHSVARKPDGNTLASGGDSLARKGVSTALYEFNPKGEVVWKLSNEDLPGRPLKFVAGFQVLPNGNIVICNWLGHGNLGKAPHLIEVTRDKKVVWTYGDHGQFKTISNIHVFAEGDTPTPADGLH